MVFKPESVAVTRLEMEACVPTLETGWPIGALLAALPATLVRVSREGAILGVESAARDGLSAASWDIVGRNVRELMPPAAAEEALLRVREALQTGAVQTFAWRPLADAHAAAYTTHIVRSGRDEVLAVLCEAAERDEAREALRQREELHRSIVRQSPNCIFLVDVESRRILDANPALPKLLGYTRDELLRLTLDDIEAHRPEDTDATIERVLREHHDIIGERQYRDRRGALVDVEVSGNLIFYGSRQVLCLFARDIRERKESEAERQRLEDRLRLSQKHEAVGRLASGVAHDFNNLLTAVNGYAELILSALEPQDPLRADVEEIRRAGARARDLTRQLLAFSGRQILEPRVFDLNAVVRDMEKLVRRTIGEDIELETDLDPDIGSVSADPGKIEQVILNLVVNARDAMPDGGTLRIATKEVVLDEAFTRPYATLHPGPHVALMISDTGRGIEAAAQKRIFEPFFTTKEQGKGSGLGLATVYGIVKQSGGSIWVDSEVGKGTIFRVYLPSVAADPEPVSVGSGARDERLPRGTETIVVVEDDRGVQALTVRVLRNLGYQVYGADHPDGALLLLERLRARRPDQRIDLVLSDVVMPRMSGPVLVGRLRAIAGDFKVLFMSGYADEGIVRHGVLEPGTQFIHKPFTRAEMARKVRDVLDSCAAAGLTGGPAVVV
ncbi:MAG: PAS domain S-box protein [Gemmatimonadetes bacterium]|nr:PAS domain S-box protein [Gemmatimonadota bacterium]